MADERPRQTGEQDFVGPSWDIERGQSETERRRGDVERAMDDLVDETEDRE